MLSEPPNVSNVLLLRQVKNIGQNTLTIFNIPNDISISSDSYSARPQTQLVVSLPKGPRVVGSIYTQDHH